MVTTVNTTEEELRIAEAMELEESATAETLAEHSKRGNRRKRSVRAYNRKANHARSIVSGISEESHRYNKCTPTPGYGKQGKAFATIKREQKMSDALTEYRRMGEVMA